MGRRTLILKGVSIDGNQIHKEHYSLNATQLKTLYAKATEEEVKRCEKSFSKLISDWNLEIESQSEEDWMNYNKIQTWISSG